MVFVSMLRRTSELWAVQVGGGRESERTTKSATADCGVKTPDGRARPCLPEASSSISRPDPAEGDPGRLSEWRATYDYTIGDIRYGILSTPALRLATLSTMASMRSLLRLAPRAHATRPTSTPAVRPLPTAHQQHRTFMFHSRTADDLKKAEEAEQGSEDLAGGNEDPNLVRRHQW